MNDNINKKMEMVRIINYKKKSRLYDFFVQKLKKVGRKNADFGIFKYFEAFM